MGLIWIFGGVGKNFSLLVCFLFGDVGKNFSLQVGMLFIYLKVSNNRVCQVTLLYISGLSNGRNSCKAVSVEKVNFAQRLDLPVELTQEKRDREM